MRARRLGVFGGTFDPPHHGHLVVAVEALEQLDLQRLIFVPAAVPPHKAERVQATGPQRLAMMRAAVAGDPSFEVSDLELQRGGTSYTVDTLRQLRERDPDAELVFLLGIDQFRTFESWREPEEIVRLARLAVFERGGEQFVPDTRYPAVRLPITRLDLSSTQIRRRVAAGLEIRYHVPQRVQRVIEEQGLYRDLP